VSSTPDDSGVYLFVFDLARTLTVSVGALGKVSLPPGRYGYIGSARRALAARLARHARRRKPLRWHIDYLTRRATSLGAIVWPWDEGRECRVAEAIRSAGVGSLVVPRFGASDCRCPGHLYALGEGGVEELAGRLCQELGAGIAVHQRRGRAWAP